MNKQEEVKPEVKEFHRNRFGEYTNHPKVLDHTLLIKRDRGELRRFIREIRKMIKSPNSYTNLNVCHDEKLLCCSVQRWEVTGRELLEEFGTKIREEGNRKAKSRRKR